MQQFTKRMRIFFALFLFHSVPHASPWFTGPLLAPAGHTIPRGHTNVELYAIDIATNGRYNRRGQLHSTPLYKTVLANPVISHGFTDWLDLQMTIPYAFNSTLGKNYQRLADVTVAAGLQVLEQNNSPKRVDMRILLQETIPTGRFDHLNPALSGTDSTGLGSYISQAGLNFQYLLPVFENHYLRTRLILSLLHSSRVRIDGLSSYGGTPTTHGIVKAGNEKNLDLAFEFTLTQHWVAVLEGYLASGQSTRFNGILSIGNIGSPVEIVDLDAGYFKVKTLAPALEYNFNENIGLIGGVWFPVAGKNTAHFMTYMLALNAFW